MTDRIDVRPIPEPARTRLAPYLQTMREAEGQMQAMRQIITDILAVADPAFADQSSGVKFDGERLEFYRLADGP
jgi:hypothetical protein